MDLFGIRKIICEIISGSIPAGRWENTEHRKKMLPFLR